MHNFKYLGINFSVKCAVAVDCTAIKRNYTLLVIFYPSAVAVSEIVRLQLLVKSFCLCIYAHLLYWCSNLIKTKCVCWNDVYRKVFHYKRYESVKELQLRCRDLPFDYVYIYAL